MAITVVRPMPRRVRRIVHLPDRHEQHPSTINRVVITGRAVTDPVTKTAKSHHGETTQTVFSIGTTKDTYLGSVIMEIQAWSRTAPSQPCRQKPRGRRRWPTHPKRIPESRRRKQTRTAIRADRLQLPGCSNMAKCGGPPADRSRRRELQRKEGAIPSTILRIS